MRAITSRVPNLVAGIIAGLLAAVVMTLAMAASRLWLGIMPPPEAVPDRVAAMLDIDTFFSLFGKYGGYNGLKKFGILSGLRAITGAGVVVGLLYAVLATLPASRRGSSILSAPRLAVGVMAGAVLAMWVAFVVFLWPVLPANYRGLPYSQARIVSIIALLSWFALFGVVLVVTYHLIVWRPRATVEDGDQVPADRLATRRSVVAVALGAILTWPIYRLLARMYDDATFSYDGLVYSGPGIQPITPTESFYTVTKNVVDPDIDRDLWRLEVTGHVDQPHTWSYDDLMGFEQVDQETTLMCISNKLGAGLFSNATWRGVRMRDLLEASGVKDGAYEVKLSGADAYTDTFAIEKAMAEETLVVYQINGEPLPRNHGFPVRIVVPGLYGEKNVKWVTRIEVVTSDEQGFYEQQGWGPNFAPRTRSDIFAPATRLPRGNVATFEFREAIQAGRPVTIKGRAFSPGNGISVVEVSTDKGTTWNPAEIFYPGTRWTWSQWSFEWTPPSPGEYVLIPRCVDGNGVAQDPEVIGIIPQGASGYQRVIATVTG